METTKKQSSLRQAEAAISHFHKGELDCAITLAAAAEGMLPTTNDPHIRQELKNDPAAEDIDLNLAINWLKHPQQPEAVNISEFEAALTIARAVTKFIAVYHQTTRRFEDFLRHAHAAGHLPRLYVSE